MGTTIGGSAPYAGPNVIMLKRERGFLEEAYAYAAFKPGHLLEYTSAGKVKKHATSGGSGERIIAKENPFKGDTIWDAYTADEQASFWICQPGAEAYGRIPAATAVVRNDLLISDGAGCFIPYTGTGSHLLYSNIAASAAISNVATITAFDKSYTIPANFLVAGDVIKIRAQGIVTAQNSTDTLIITLKIGSTTIKATAAVDSAVSDIWQISADLVVRTIGASGTFVGHGTQANGVLATAAALPFLLASTAIDTTATQAITVSATWSVASASNSTRLDVLTVETSRPVYQQIFAKALEAKDNSGGSDEAFCRLRFM